MKTDPPAIPPISATFVDGELEEDELLEGTFDGELDDDGTCEENELMPLELPESFVSFVLIGLGGLVVVRLGGSAVDCFPGATVD